MLQPLHNEIDGGILTPEHAFQSDRQRSQFLPLYFREIHDEWRYHFTSGAFSLVALVGVGGTTV